MLGSAAFWYFVTFIIFLILFGRLLWKPIAQVLDNRAVQIEEDIKDAARIKEEAQAALNDIRDKHLKAEKQAESIIEHAKLEAERLKEEASKEIDEFLKQKELVVEQHIKFAELQAINEVRDTVVQLATEASKHILSDLVNDQANKKLIDEAIKEISAS